MGVDNASTETNLAGDAQVSAEYVASIIHAIDGVNPT